MVFIDRNTELLQWVNIFVVSFWNHLNNIGMAICLCIELKFVAFLSIATESCASFFVSISIK